MFKQQRRTRPSLSLRAPGLSAVGAGPDVGNSYLLDELATSRRRGGEGSGLLGRLFGGRRNQPQPQPRPQPTPAVEVPTPQPVTEVVEPEVVVDEPTPSVDVPSPAIDAPVVEAPTMPSWAEDLTEEPAMELPTGRELIEGWEQTSKGNCVTVAAIKAAQKTFGAQLAHPDDPTLGVFESATEREDGGMDVVMRDGFALSLTAEEFAAAALSSRFKTDVGRDDLLTNANQLYAVAAKRAQIEGNDGIGPGEMSYDRALKSLEDGEHTARITEQVGRLGLGAYAERIPRTELENYESTLSSGSGHAYFVSNGDRDYYGKVGPLNSKPTSSPRRWSRRPTSSGTSTMGTVLHREPIEP